MCIRDRFGADRVRFRLELRRCHVRTFEVGIRLGVRHDDRCFRAAQVVDRDYIPVSYTHLDVYKRQPPCRSSDRDGTD